MTEIYPHDFTKTHNEWVRARRAFLPYGGVVGVGYGPKYKAGKLAARYAIIILVERKLPPDDVPEGQLIPPSFEGIPTDVRVPQITRDTASADSGNKLQHSDHADIQWIDWPKIHRRRIKSHHRDLPEMKPTVRGEQ